MAICNELFFFLFYFSFLSFANCFLGALIFSMLKEIKRKKNENYFLIISKDINFIFFSYFEAQKKEKFIFESLYSRNNFPWTDNLLVKKLAAKLEYSAKESTPFSYWTFWVDQRWRKR
jgi:hypothetical protein